MLMESEQACCAKHRCDTCKQTGHWKSNHYSYICSTCNKPAPGHYSGSNWCPEIGKTKAAPYDLDTDRKQEWGNNNDWTYDWEDEDRNYDFSEDAIHNMNT